MLETPNVPDGLEPPGPAVRWSTPRMALFRFVTLYFGLYFLPFPVSALAGLTSLPRPLMWIGLGAAKVAGWYEGAMQHAVLWFGTHGLRLPEGSIVIQPTGSGDTMLAYTQALFGLTVAVAGTLVWTAADRRRAAYPRLEGLLRIYLRYVLASIMLGYGLAKLPPTQFQPPGPERLMRTFGESSPMGLLWTFMGFSPAYTMFAGVCEIIPALLLLFRRTATLGALISIGVLLNIVLLNFCYDVPVKLFSLHLLATGAAVLLPSWPRLANVLILNRATGPVVIWTPLKRRWQNWSIGIAKLCFVVLMLGTGVAGAVSGWKSFGPGKPKPPLYGLYEVESMTVDGAERPPLLTDAGRWRWFAVTSYGRVVTQNVAGAREFMLITYDEKAGTVLLQTMGANARNMTMKCERTADGSMVLEGDMGAGKARIALKKSPEPALNSRGFHWVQELPYNR
jgi:hypothetical protein